MTNKQDQEKADQGELNEQNRSLASRQLSAADQQSRLELEAATFRRLLRHLDENSQVQNIDLMNLAGFCRNCLSKWYLAEAKEKGIDLDYEGARQIVYGMPYQEWKAKYQTEASAEQQAAFEQRQAD